MRQREQLAQALGWFSMGLGLTEVFAPRSLAKAIGLRDSPENEALLRIAGLREIASGLAILTQQQPLTGVRARVGGDVMDIAVPGMAPKDGDGHQGKVALAAAAVLGVTALDVLCCEQLSQSQNLTERSYRGDGRENKRGNGSEQSNGNGGLLQEKVARNSGKVKSMDITQAVTINKSAEELYAFWHDFENLAHFMNHLKSVQVTGPKRSHWKAKAPAGKTVEWDAEIIDDQPNQLIAWRSLEGADVDNAGSVRFERAPGGRGTVVKVQMQYNPPGGKIGAGIAKLFGEEPDQQTWEDLHRFKQLMETGEIVLSDGCLEGMGSKQRPGQPADPTKS